MKRTLKIRVGSIASALDLFEETWRKAARGEKARAEHAPTFVSKSAARKKPPSGGWAVRDTRGENSLTVTSSRGGRRIIRRDAKTGSFASQHSATRIRDTSKRAADSLKRLAKR
jgi:hypothetical protein